MKTFSESKNSTAKKNNNSGGFWKKHPVLAAAMKALVFFIVVIFVGEVTFRYLDTMSRDTPRNKGGIEFKPDPEIFWRLRPHLNMQMDLPKGGYFMLNTNSQGLRNPEIPFEKPKGAYRIQCYGDSITYGYGVDYEFTYEYQLQSMLREEYSRQDIDVMNFGCPGYTAFQGWYLFNRLGIKYDPNLIILGFTYADPSTEEKRDSERITSNPMVLAFQKFLYNSELYLALRQQKINVDRAGRQPDYYLTSVRVSLPEYREIMTKWAEVMNKRGGHVIYLSLAKAWDDPFPYYDDYRKVCEETAAETGNYFIDIDKVFEESGEDLKSLFQLSVADNEDVDRIHPNERGYYLMTKAISELIEQEGLLFEGR